MQTGDSAERLVKRAFSLAKKGYGKTSPNPMVGAVLLRDGVIVGEGYHQKAGAPHAEINAISAAGNKAEGADLYINLEPCSHHGRTPPCVEAVIKAGIRRAFIAMVDPNPKVSGRGITLLKDAGIEVHVGILEAEARKLNEAYIKHIATGMPFVILKAAATLDGKTATKTGDSKWITGETSRQRVHRMRNGVDAILVGIKTIERDNPLLTARLRRGKGKDPARVVLDEELKISTEAHVVNPESEAPLIIATTDKAPTPRIIELERLGIEVLVFKNADGLVPLRPLIKELGSMGIVSLIIEGGSEVHASALREKIVDKIAFFYAPKIIGGVKSLGIVGGSGAKYISEAIEVDEVTTKKIGKDLLVEGYVKYGTTTAEKSIQSS